GPEPARLEVEAPRGAEIRVDGVFVGVAPLPKLVDAEPGRHRVVVTLGGHEPVIEQVLLERGETTTLTTDPAETDQRIGSWVALGTGAAGVGTGIVLGVLAVIEQRDAAALSDGPAHDAALEARDRYRTAATVAGLSGVGLFVAGALLFALDEPELPGPERDEERGATVSALPLCAPDLGGAALRIRF
ncbi:MAG: PEGA domain-containing protein, partial [Polyangiaceae bacterium]|nr:PEGA domain-containing protein [Polyangiaceae bacterium]